MPRPRRRFAQHFLVDQRALRRIYEALSPTPASIVLEIGAGKGALTDLLAREGARVIAIEVDRDLAGFLRRRYASASNVQIVEGDALDLDWPILATPPYLLVGNLPYNLTTPLLFKSLEPPLPERAVFLVQREVAERIVARPGGKEYGALSVNVQVATVGEVVAQVPASAFRPRPAVDSAVVRLAPHTVSLLSDVEARPFRFFVQAIFGMRRKQLQRVLRELDHRTAESAIAILEACGIDPAARPETISPAAFVTLFRARLALAAR